MHIINIPNIFLPKYPHKLQADIISLSFYAHSMLFDVNYQTIISQLSTLSYVLQSTSSFVILNLLHFQQSVTLFVFLNRPLEWDIGYGIRVTYNGYGKKVV